MLNKNEIISIIVMTLILAFAFSIKNFSLKSLSITGLAILLIFSINIFAKKIAAYYFESEIEMKIWSIKRYGLFGAHSKGFFHPNREFKHPLMTGAFLPIITAAFSWGYVVWMACFNFDVKAKTYRTAKRHGFYSFSEMTESHIGFIAAAGILANLVFSIIGYFAGWELFSKLNIYYAFFNMIPLSDLDGNKIYFGEIILWSFLAVITLLGLAYVFVVI